MDLINLSKLNGQRMREYLETTNNDYKFNALISKHIILIGINLYLF